MIEPLIMQQGNRKAIITGKRVSLLKKRNKQRDAGVWPEVSIIDPVARLYTAQAWVMKGIIDDDLVKH